MQRNRSPANRAFALVEFLVVIAILTAILFPVFAPTKLAATSDANGGKVSANSHFANAVIIGPNEADRNAFDFVGTVPRPQADLIGPGSASTGTLENDTVGWGKSSAVDPVPPDDSLTRVDAQSVRATRIAPPLPKGFLLGGDPSEIPEVEASGAKWIVGGKATDPFVAMRAAGWNLVRFRVWNDPGSHPEAHGWADKAHTLVLAKRAKAAGLAISIDLHYSDWWADPQKQIKPAAWKDLPFEGLTRAVHDWTKDVIGALKAQGTPPVMVQIGNEITPGMLWPDGRNDTPEGWARLGRLVAAGTRAVREVDPGIKTMIHLDRGGDNAGCRWFFDHLQAELRTEKVDFDLIGLSYYPWWHGPLGALRANLNDLAARYGKDVYVVETAYPYAVASGDGPTLFDGKKTEPGFPATPEGQAAFVRSVIGAVRDVPGGRGKGVLYWAPLWIGEPGRRGGYRNLAVFDPEGRALPAFAALGGH